MRSPIPTAYVVFAILLCAQAANSAPPAASISEEEAFDLATQVYVYGYPLVNLEMTRRVTTNVALPVGGKAPMCQFANLRDIPTPASTDIIAPSADTLYSVAWVDVSKEPYVLSLPDMGDRYYVMPMLSAWGSVFEVLGTRTTGSKAQTYAITGPNWKTPLPIAIKEIKAPTDIVWILGRIWCAGSPADCETVRTIQDKLSLMPLSWLDKPRMPPAGTVDASVDTRTPIVDQVNSMSAAAYFEFLAELMKSNSPSKEDAAIVAKMKRIGIEPGQDFDVSQLDPAIARAIERARKAGLEQIFARVIEPCKKVNDWTIPLKIGDYGIDYVQRAAALASGFGSVLPQDIVYPTTCSDADGRQLSGQYRYVLRFDKGQLPPVKALWSVTLYDTDYHFTANSINRYALSSTDPLRYNPDGSLDIYIQHAMPDSRDQFNWLPAPSGNFLLMLRLYWPTEPPSPSILNGTWKPPAILRKP